MSTDLAPAENRSLDAIVDTATYTADQAAVLIGVRPTRARELIRAGRIRSARTGRVYRIKGADIRTYLRQRAAEPEHLTVPQVARELRLAEATVRSLIHAGTLPAEKVHGEFRIAPTAVDALFGAVAS